MLRVKGIMTLTVFLLCILIVSSVSAQSGKYGYIDSDKIFTEWKEWTKAQEEFDTDYKAWEEEAREQQKELEELITEYEKQKLILSADKKKEREAAIEAKQQSLDSFTREVFGPNGAAERKNNALVKPLLDKINAAIESVAIEENYDFIFNAGGLAYAKKDFEITEKVLKLLEEE
jgi:outer membrane protein